MTHRNQRNNSGRFLLTGRLLAAAAALALGSGSFAIEAAPATVSFQGAHWDKIKALEYRSAQPNGKTVILVHGCGGPNDSTGQLRGNMQDWTQRFLTRGWNVLIPDSFATRGIKTVCGKSEARKPINARERAEDIAGAIEWVHGKDPKAKIVLIGFSHGAMTLLRGLRHFKKSQASAAIVFYPPCTPFLKELGDYSVSVPTLFLTAQEDNWTPAADCMCLKADLVRQGNPVELISYPDAVHGFDFPTPVKTRSDIMGSDGTPVRVGGNPEALSQSIKDVFGFLEKTLAD